MIDLNKLKQLREETGISLIECKKALEEADGDLEKAKEVLRKKGQEWSARKSSRQTKAGIIEAYIHANKKIGVLLDLRCETDFVAATKEFKDLAHDLCLQIAAMNPKFIKPDDIPEQTIEKEKEIYKEQFSKTNKPPEIIEKIVAGKIKQFKEENCLLTQAFIRDPEKTVAEVINETIAKIGENIVIKRFVRFEI